MSDTPRTKVCHCSLPSIDPDACSKCCSPHGLTVAEYVHYSGPMCYTPDKCFQLERDLAAVTAERDALLAECERERMRLAACGVVALANTLESAAKARTMHADYWSASCQDVAKMVDREIALRAENERLRELIAAIDDQAGYQFVRYDGTLTEIGKRISAALESET